MKVLYQTTPIFYVNDVPHAGHAYCTVACDALARARRLQGHRVFFLTGTDEHGQNIERVARERGVPEQDYCDQIAGHFRALWTRLDISYDGFIRTTDALHKRGVLALWERLRAATGPDGQPVIYRGRYAGLYCPRCEAFKDEAELRQPGDICPDHERACEFTEEENFFFRLSAYQGWLEGAIRSGALTIEPEGRRNEVLSVLRQGLQDFSVSRARVRWGIPVPEEPGHVFYVWMDALANYITALGFGDGDPKYREFWEQADERMHLIGKEIIRFHCLYWPAMLQAAGLPVPQRIFAHDHITKGGRRLSKSTGNVISPDALVDRLGVDAFRYFFLREGSFGQDWDFTDAAFVGRFNSDLANDFGNLVSRALTMVQRYCGGVVPERPTSAGSGSGREAVFQLEAERCWGEVFARYEALDFAGALALLWSYIAELNQRIVVTAPWELAKDPARKRELDDFLYRLLEAVRLIALMASPVIPRASGRVFGMLGLEQTEATPADLAWGRLVPGSRLGTVEPLFPRVEKDGAPREKREKVSDKPALPVAAPPVPPAATPATPAAVVAPATAAELLDIADFARVDLRAAVVTAAERIAGSKRLLKLQVDLGTETRQIVSGIAEAYAPEALVGKTVALVCNLKPAKLMGVESNGMVLAASLDGKAVLCVFDGPVAPGTKIK